MTGRRRTSNVPASGRAVARYNFPMPLVCESCNENPPADRHHKDGNATNNDPNNIAFLCRRCHMVADGRLDASREACIVRNAVNHCKKGHPFDDENTVYTSGQRRCRICQRNASRRYWHRKGRERRKERERAA